MILGSAGREGGDGDRNMTTAWHKKYFTLPYPNSDTATGNLHPHTQQLNTLFKQPLPIPPSILCYNKIINANVYDVI
jgi:hypothetical protein